MCTLHFFPRRARLTEFGKFWRVLPATADLRPYEGIKRRKRSVLGPWIAAAELKRGALLIFGAPSFVASPLDLVEHGKGLGRCAIGAAVALAAGLFMFVFPILG